MEQRMHGCSLVKAEGGHAGGQGVAVEHQGTSAHPWVASARPKTVLGGVAMRIGGDGSGSDGSKLLVAAQPGKWHRGGSAEWEVEGEIGWDGGGSKNERRWWPRSLIGSHGGIHALRMRGTEAVDLGRHALFRSRSVLELILRNLVELPYESGS